jgi:hypothetical protein
MWDNNRNRELYVLDEDGVEQFLPNTNDVEVAREFWRYGFILILKSISNVILISLSNLIYKSKRIKLKFVLQQELLRLQAMPRVLFDVRATYLLSM